ncbi:agmatine deiminase [Sphingopyxis terrae subsp. terrae NBRC 15098]|uniref:Agmatine deiminase n=1 Tax=Sphingopyxis terrae subsp. terrae NBRC 15098 TaxID=1219058 RepID=A0A142W127_9SPHN|nr:MULTISPECIES: agmatine deiminase family protein [Sphingopyxis]AMU95744.1 agmatine deiminase [Sphingopyxis terrae subsp. terrae NBRC 15098]
MTLHMPAEWAPHAAVWIGFPHLDDEWAGQIDAARADVAAFANVVHDGGRGEEVRLVVNDERQAQIAAALVDNGVRILVQPLGDIWLRDTGPIIVGTGLKRRARNFRFNWWGEKFVMPGDQEVGAALATESGLPVDEQDWVLEGGGIDVDGTGLCVTTEECLLNINRNPSLTRADIAVRLHQSLGIDRLLWLGKGLVGDHTDGHVDNLARFVGEGRLALPVAAGSDDPNADIYEDARVRAAAFGGIEIVDLPSPGRVEMDGEIVAASYMNFYIGNTVVVVPTYGVANDAAAVEALAVLFPDRRAVGVPARGIIAGGGSFHCSSQQVPA